jgi:hypothetical protein
MKKSKLDEIFCNETLCYQVFARQKKKSSQITTEGLEFKF